MTLIIIEVTTFLYNMQVQSINETHGQKHWSKLGMVETINTNFVNCNITLINLELCQISLGHGQPHLGTHQ